MSCCVVFQQEKLRESHEFVELSNIGAPLESLATRRRNSQFILILLRGREMLPGVRSAKGCFLAGFTGYPYVYSCFLESMLVFI
jgi:hypothetical protein